MPIRVLAGRPVVLREDKCLGHRAIEWAGHLVCLTGRLFSGSGFRLRPEVSDGEPRLWVAIDLNCLMVCSRALESDAPGCKERLTAPWPSAAQITTAVTRLHAPLSLRLRGQHQGCCGVSSVRVLAGHLHHQQADRQARERRPLRNIDQSAVLQSVPNMKSDLIQLYESSQDAREPV